MAQNSAAPGGKLTLFSLTGYLELLQKKNLFKSAYRRYWFWFDEQTCSLKYYRNQETYTMCVHEPLGTIDLRYAKVTPGITSGSGANNIFNINADGQLYVVAAKDSDQALAWISNLQDKRGEFIKLSAAMEETALEQEKDRRTLRPFNKPVGALAAEETDHSSSPNVRQIVQSKLSRGSMALELISTSPQTDHMRHLSFDPLMCRQPEIDGPLTPNTPLTSESRKILELEALCLDYQVNMNKIQKENMRLKEQLEHRDKAILELNSELSQLREEISKMNRPHHELKSEMSSLKDIIEQYKRSVKSLNDEVQLQKLNQKQHDKRINQEKQRVVEVEKELNTVKSKYIKLLSTQFKVNIPNPASVGQEEALDDIELSRHTHELLELVELEGGVNLTLKGSFEDEYGEIHDWNSDVVTHHYLCRQLYLHYILHEVESHAHDWEEFLSQVKRTRKPYLDLTNGDRTKKELRSLLRKGVPNQYRMIVWTSLIFQHVGRMKELKDSATEGGSYYWSLVHSDVKGGSEKQIKIDLHRTLPNNRHFKLNGSGIPKLDNILMAFSKHNTKIGYCQGMNMVAALGLLFLDEETVFWYMVCITEKLLPNLYYTPNLQGVQADQLLMKDLLMEKLPRLHSHLENYGIDVSFVTLNWFLTLFVDSMPTESAMRIMDCFLMEGIKFIFRTSLGILRMNQSLILQKQDPFVLFQFVKEIAKHIFDIEALYQEFPKLAPFPNRASINSRHHSHLSKVKVQCEKREKEKAEKERQRIEPHKLLSSSSFVRKEPLPVPKERLVWECGCVCGRGEVWLCGGEGRLGVVSAMGTLIVPESRIIQRVICSHYLPMLDLLLMGSLDFNLTAVSCSSKAEKWRISLSDSVLAITGSEKKIFAALADGHVAMLQEVTGLDAPVPQMLRIGSTSVSAVLLSGPDQCYLWCGCGKSVTIISTETLESVESLVMLDRVNKLVGSDIGVWVSYRSSSHISLYDTQHFVVLLSLDYCILLPPQQVQSDKEVLLSSHRITSLTTSADKLWVGTGGGRVLIFACVQNIADTKEAIHSLAKHKKIADTETTPSSNPADSGGLLTSVVVGGAKDAATSPPDDEKWVDIAEEISAHKVPGYYYQKRRRTQFGKTLRNKSHKHHKRKDLPDIYRLDFLTCSSVIPSANDSVRVLVSCSGSGGDVGNSFTVSCVNSVRTDWKEGVQLWTCPSDTPPSQWTFKALPPSQDKEEHIQLATPPKDTSEEGCDQAAIPPNVPEEEQA